MEKIKLIFKQYFSLWFIAEYILLSLTFTNFLFFILFIVVVLLQLLYYKILIIRISKINIKLDKNDRLLLLSIFKKNRRIITNNPHVLNLYMCNLVNSYLALKQTTKNKHLLGINYVNILNIIKKIRKKKFIEQTLIKNYIYNLNSKKYNCSKI